MGEFLQLLGFESTGLTKYQTEEDTENEQTGKQL